MNFINFILISLGIINLFLTAVVFTRNHHNPVNKSFAVFLVNAIIWSIAISLFRANPNPHYTVFWARMIYLTGTLLPITFILFSSILTSKKLPFLLKHSLPIAALTFIFFILFTDFFIRYLPITNSISLGLLYILWFVYYIFLMGYGAHILWQKFTTSKGYPKTQLRFVLLSIIFPLFGAIPFNFILPYFGNFELVYFGPLFLTAMSGTITYAIIKHRFLDIRLIISKAVAYTLLLLTLAGAYIFSIFITSSLFLPTPFNQDYLLLSTILAVFTAFTFQPLRRLFEKLTTNIFYKDSYQTDQLINSISTILASHIKIDSLVSKTINQLCRTMHLTKACIAVPNQNNLSIIKYSGSNLLNLSEETLSQIQKVDRLSIFDELPENDFKHVLRQADVAAIIPLKTKTRNVGYLITSHKKSGDILYNQDITVFEILDSELAVAIQNSLSYTKIKSFNATLKKKVLEATTDLRKANRHLRHLDKIKDEFVFVATHEIKNPVTAMKGYLSMIGEGEFGRVPSKLTEALNQLNRSNQQLVDLVNNLLQIARTEAEKLEIETIEINLCEHIEEVINSVRPLADQKNIHINYACSVDKIKVKADAERLKEVFNNLISNAIKYSEKGAITVSYAEEGNQVITHIKDEGVGIPDKDKSKIFTRFFRVEEEAAKGVPGSGLGLFIVRQLVEKMGGKIWFSSKLGAGSTFSFSLPKS